MARNARKTPRRGRRGVAAVELAVSVMVLVMLVLGIIEFSRLGMASQLLTNAAREGCRLAVIQNSTTDAVQTRINTMLAPAGLTVGNVTAVTTDPGTEGVYITPSNWASCAGDTPVTLTIRVPFSKVSWSSPFFLKSANVVGTATMNSEHP